MSGTRVSARGIHDVSAREGRNDSLVTSSLKITDVKCEAKFFRSLPAKVRHAAAGIRRRH